MTNDCDDFRNESKQIDNNVPNQATYRGHEQNECSEDGEEKTSLHFA